MHQDLYKQLTWSQMDASLLTLEHCISRCPNERWNLPVANLKFCQAVFHTLFFADFYLAPSEEIEPFKRQSFHVEHAVDFQDYEEVQDKLQMNLYERGFTLAYLLHCRHKARSVIFAETDASLAGPSGFSWRKCSRAELHIYNTRHVQHHAAQLSLRLRLDAAIDIPWVGAGKVMA